MLTLSKPASRTDANAARPSAASWPRARAVSSESRSDWMPRLIRVTPASRIPAPVGPLASPWVPLQRPLLEGDAGRARPGRRHDATDLVRTEQGGRAPA